MLVGGRPDPQEQDIVLHELAALVVAGDRGPRSCVKGVAYHAKSSRDTDAHQSASKAGEYTSVTTVASDIVNFDQDHCRYFFSQSSRSAESSF
jgi:hypothetical protein